VTTLSLPRILLLSHALLAIVAVALSSVAGGAEQADRDLVGKVLDASGTRAALDRLPALARAQAQADQGVQALPEDQRKRVEDAFVAAFAPAAMYKTMSDELLKRFDAESFQGYLEAYRSPLAQQFVKLDLRLMEPAVWKDKEAFVKALAPERLTEPRGALLKELDDATMASAPEAQASLRNLAGRLERQPGETEPAHADRVRRLRENAYTAAQNRYVATRLFAYQGVADGELEKYVRLNQQEPVSQVSRAIAMASLVAMLESLDRLAAALRGG
jgi:hypothetical protein